MNEEKEVEFQISEIVTQVPAKSKSIQVPRKQSFKQVIFRKAQRICSFFNQMCYCFQQKEEIKIYKPQIQLQLPKIRQVGKKTLVLDLDETLVHSTHFPTKTPDFLIPIETKTKKVTFFVYIRPGAREFIKRMSEYYELVVFTASLNNYGNSVLDQFDNRKIIDHRLFREHCTQIEGFYIKDLEKLGRNMKDIIIIDVEDVRRELRKIDFGVENQEAATNTNQFMVKSSEALSEKIQFQVIREDVEASKTEKGDQQKELFPNKITKIKVQKDIEKSQKINSKPQNLKILSLNKSYTEEIEETRQKLGVNSPSNKTKQNKSFFQPTEENQDS